MAQDTSDGRQIFQRQPARAVLIDFSPPMDMGTCINIQQALTNTLTLLNHISGGPNRVPFIGIIVLGNYPECIYPLQPLKGNFVRLTTALKGIRSLSRNLVSRQHHSRGCILEGLQEALAQFHRLAQNYRQGPGSACFPAQIDLTLLTSQSAVSVRSLVERFADHLDLQHLKKISGVCMSDPERLVSAECDSGITEGDGVGLSQITSSPTELGLSMLDMVSIDNDVLSLQNVFQGWLLDCSTDSEALHLILPPGLCRSGLKEEGEHTQDSSLLTVKCDIHERLLDPNLMGSLGQQFSLNSSLPPLPGNRGGANSTLRSTNLPVYKLTAAGLVAADGICESVVFGLPQILRPTTCWKLDWEELEMNQQHFNALCQLLQDKGQVLVARTDNTHPSFSPHFLVLPSSSNTLLIKSVAVSELILPLDVSPGIEQPTSDVQQTVASSLEKLELYETYNPLLIQSGLYEALSLTKKSNLSRQAQRTTLQPPPSSGSIRGRPIGKNTGHLGTGGRRNYQKKGLGFQ